MNSGRGSQQPAMIMLMACLMAGALTSGPACGADFSYGEVGEKNKACLSCHADPNKTDTRTLIDEARFSHTTHARFGCRSCHDGVSTSHPDGRSVAHTTTCRDCHSDIAAQYSQSQHARNASCGGCHNPHQVMKAEQVSGDDLNRQCAGCHKKSKVTNTHSRWLPQAALHLDAIACVACHSKAENYVVSISLSRHSGKGGTVPAGYADLLSKTGGADLRSLIDRNNDGYISLDELRRFNQNPDNKELYLRGMIIPTGPTHDFQTFDNRWNCTFCHASGPEIMQTSYLTLPEANGTHTRVAVERGAVLDALHAIPDFYLMGSARNTSLNKIGLAIIAGGLVMPLGHGFIRFLTRKNR